MSESNASSGDVRCQCGHAKRMHTLGGGCLASLPITNGQTHCLCNRFTSAGERMPAPSPKSLPVDTATLTERLNSERGAASGTHVVVSISLLEDAAAALSSLKTRLEEANDRAESHFEHGLAIHARWLAAEAREKELSEALEWALDVLELSLARLDSIDEYSAEHHAIRQAGLAKARAALVDVRGEEKGLEAGDESEIRRSGEGQ